VHVLPIVGDLVVLGLRCGTIDVYVTPERGDYRTVFTYNGDDDGRMWPCTVLNVIDDQMASPFIQVITEHGVGWVNMYYVERVLR